MTRANVFQLTTLLLLVFVIGLATLWQWQRWRTTSTTPVPAAALATPQPGGVLVRGATVEPDHLNPIYATNTSSLAIIEKLYPPLVGQDPTTGAAGISGLAEKWTFAEEGHLLTLTLYQDLRWSNGEPLTTEDIRFTYQLLQDPAVDSPYQPNFANVRQVDPLDDRTIQLRLATPDCTILQTLRQPIIPAHLYQGDVERFLATDPQQPLAVSAGPFTFVDHIDRRGDAEGQSRIILRRNPFYRFGAPFVERWELHIFHDEATAWAQLTAGAVDLMPLEPERFASVAAVPEVALYTAPRDSITFLALNLADPDLPQNGRAADGTLLPQSAHPILGDRQVRRAVAHAIDNEMLLQNGYGENAFPLQSYLLPSIKWAHHDQLQPYLYDPAQARETLAAAGWHDEDGDGIRERAGERLQLTLLTNADSPARVKMARQLPPQLQAVGIELQVVVASFEELTATLLDQTYDVALIGWNNLGAEPANSDFWHSRQDLPGQGANFVSFQDREVDQWLDEARTAPACEGGYRVTRYQQIQERIHRELPYIILGGRLQGWAYRTEWQGVTPQPWQVDYNVSQWWQGQ